MNPRRESFVPFPRYDDVEEDRPRLMVTSELVVLSTAGLIFENWKPHSALRAQGARRVPHEVSSGPQVMLSAVSTVLVPCLKKSVVGLFLVSRSVGVLILPSRSVVDNCHVISLKKCCGS